MKLLVPVDGSTASFAAAKKAIEIAIQYKFTVKLVHVIESDEVSSQKRNEKLWNQVNGSIISGKEESQSSPEVAAEQLIYNVMQSLDSKGVQIETAILKGKAHEQILELAQNEKIDLIIMNHCGLSKMKSLLGSVTQKVIAQSQCPVLVIHADSCDTGLV